MIMARHFCGSLIFRVGNALELPVQCVSGVATLSPHFSFDLEFVYQPVECRVVGSTAAPAGRISHFPSGSTASGTKKYL